MRAGARRRLLLARCGRCRRSAPPGRADLAADVGVTGLGEVELAELPVRTEHAVLRPLERRAAGGLGERIRVERRGAVGGRVVDRDPLRGNVMPGCAGRGMSALGMSASAWPGWNTIGEPLRLTCSTWSLPPRGQVMPVLRDEPVDEAVRLARVRVRGALARRRCPRRARACRPSSPARPRSRRSRARRSRWSGPPGSGQPATRRPWRWPTLRSTAGASRTGTRSSRRTEDASPVSPSRVTRCA